MAKYILEEQCSTVPSLCAGDVYGGGGGFSRCFGLAVNSLVCSRGTFYGAKNAHHTYMRMPLVTCCVFDWHLAQTRVDPGSHIRGAIAGGFLSWLSRSSQLAAGHPLPKHMQQRSAPSGHIYEAITDTTAVSSKTI